MTGDVDPDTWWSQLTQRRKQQIFRWVEQPQEPGPLPGQTILIDIEKADHAD